MQHHAETRSLGELRGAEPPTIRSIRDDSELWSLLVQAQATAVIDAYPGGATYLVMVPSSSHRDLYPIIDRQIMRLVEAGQLPGFQQGGFIEPPTTPNSAARLQMAYGELCLNGVRSVATWIVQNSSVQAFDRSVLWPAQPNQTARKVIECSGASHPVDVSVDLGPQAGTGWAEVAVPHRPEPREGVRIELAGRKIGGDLVKFDGITHLVINSEDLPNSLTEPAAAVSLIREAAEKFKCHHNGVFGLIGVRLRHGVSKTGGPMIGMEPWVMVCGDPPQFFYEQSCGSGACAAAISWAFAKTRHSTYSCEIIPPSNLPLTVSGMFSREVGAFSHTRLAGAVTIRDYLPL